MGPWAISIIIGFGFGVWVYNRIMRLTGSNREGSVIIGAISGVFATGVARWLLSLIY